MIVGAGNLLKRFTAGLEERIAALLLKFFGPLEVAAAILTAAAATLSWLDQSAGSQLLVISTILAVVVLALFPLYFQRVNASFAAGTIAPDRVAEELRRWSFWHWVRTLIATAAFISALGAIMMAVNG